MRRSRSRMWLKACLIACLAGMCAPVAGEALARDRTEKLSFARGATSTTIKGRISGYDGVTYRVGATAGQTMTVSLKTGNPSTYFNVTAPGASQAVHIGSVDGERFSMTVPSSGDYLVNVYLMRNAARRNERANYTLTVRISGTVDPATDPDFADGLAGGPDVWRVTNVPAGDRLNIRSTPSAQGRVVARVDNGARLRNLGCRMSGSTRWCRVEGRGGTIGWAAGRFLRE